MEYSGYACVVIWLVSSPIMSTFFAGDLLRADRIASNTLGCSEGATAMLIDEGIRVSQCLKVTKDYTHPSAYPSCPQSLRRLSGSSMGEIYLISMP